MKRLFAVLVLGSFSVKAQTITETFGSGANQFEIDFVEIGNPGNDADTTGAPSPGGRVEYVYNIGKYEISRDIINKANASFGLAISLGDMTLYGGNGANRPATGISWFEAAKFVNYLNTSKNYHVAYNFDSNGNFQFWGVGHYIGNNQLRHKDAYYFLPSVDEWYKAAYGSPSGTWYKYGTGSDNAPAPVTSGTEAETAIYGQQGPADIFDAGGLNAYGVMAMTGNVWEWTESWHQNYSDNFQSSSQARGGAWYSGDDTSPWNSASGEAYGSGGISANAFAGFAQEYEFVANGFRVAMVPEPSSLSLLLVGGTVLMAVRQRKRD